MSIFLNNQLNKLSELPVFSSNKKYLNKITHLLNKNRMVILSWLHKSWKHAFVKDLLLKTWLENKCFLFNKDYTINEYINWEKLINIFNDSLNNNKNIKLIVLSNFNKIENIKDFIQYIYNHENNFKILLIWNTIQIPWIQEIEYLTDNIETINFLDTNINYGVLPEIIYIPFNLQQSYLNLAVNDVFTKEIFINFWVKDMELYHFTMTYLSKTNKHISFRELQKWLSEIQQITLKTVIDYINFSLRAKIIKPVNKYDFKKQKVILSRIKYYFTDSGIRNSISKYSLPKNILKENLLYQLLEYNDYKIYSGLNGIYEFTFYCKSEQSELCITYSQVTEKNELKKEINKLNKVPVAWKKYIILDSIEQLWIKKLTYNNVEIIEWKDIQLKIETK
jgi:hypothetical protein